MILTNELPRIADSSGALASRFHRPDAHKSFYGREDHDLTGRLLGELPGILNWSIEGWERLRDRGRFQQPASSAEAIQELEDLGSPIGAFIRERCTVAPGRSVQAQTSVRRVVALVRSAGPRPCRDRSDVRARSPGRGARIEGHAVKKRRLGKGLRGCRAWMRPGCHALSRVTYDCTCRAREEKPGTQCSVTRDTA